MSVDSLRIFGTDPQLPTVVVAQLDCRTEEALQHIPHTQFEQEYKDMFDSQSTQADPVEQMRTIVDESELQHFDELVGGSPTMTQFLARAAANPKFAALTLHFGVRKTVGQPRVDEGAAAEAIDEAATEIVNPTVDQPDLDLGDAVVEMSTISM